MPDFKLMQVVAAFGVPGIAIGVYYLVTKRLPFKLSTVTPIFAGIALIMMIFFIGVGLLTALYLWRPERGLPSKEVTPPTEKPTDTLDAVPEARVERNTMFELTSNRPADSIGFTINTAILEKRPFPKLRVTIMNRSGQTHLITALKIGINSFEKKKGNEEPAVLSVTSIWQINLPTKTGRFVAKAKNAIKVPDGSPVVIDLVFAVKSGKKFLHPTDVGKYDCTLALVTDLKTEITSPVPLRF